MPRISIIFFCFMALMMGSISNGSAQDEYPGRLFTTPEERDSIDSIRYAREPEIKPITLPDPDKSVREKELTTKTAPVTFNGYVKNQKGELVYWVNSNNSMESGFNKDQFVLQNVKPDSGIVRLFIENKKTIELEVGESYEP